MKKPIALLLCLVMMLSVMVSFTACEDAADVPDSVSSAPATPAESADFSPIVFFERYEKTGYKEYLIIGGVKQGKICGMESYTFSGRPWSDFIYGTLTETVDIGAMPDRKLAFFDEAGNRYGAVLDSVDCVGRAIDGYTEIHASVQDGDFDCKRAVGVLSGKFSDTGITECSDNVIKVDIDRNGKQDSIKRIFTESKDKGYYSYSIEISVNNKEFILNNSPDMYCRKDDLSIFIGDLNGDGVSEITVYERYFEMTSRISVFEYSGNTLNPVLDYCVDPGP